MDDLEFKKRVLANPHDTDEATTAAASTTPERLQFKDEARRLDEYLRDVINSVPVPAGLRERLSPPESHVIALPVRARLSRYYALAASVVIAVGVILSGGLESARPSASDLQFHDNVINHVYREAARYDNSAADLSWQQINAVLEEAGGHLRDDERIKSMHIKFANDCNIAPAGRGAHIVLEGSKGSVSVIIMNSSPVTKKFDVNDPRFAGKIIPLGMGNLIIVGEKEEPLETYEALITETFEWSI